MLPLHSAIAAVLLLAASSSAQVIFIVPATPKLEKRYGEYLTTFMGVKGILGEPKLGITCSPGNIQRTGGAEAKNELWLLDPADPLAVPYKVDGGVKVKAAKGSVLSFPGDEFPTMRYVDELQTLSGLALDFQRRSEEAAAARQARDASVKGTTEWFAHHGILLARSERLQSWLGNMGFPAAAKKLAKEIEKEQKVAGASAVAERERAAKASVKAVPVPEGLLAASQAITGGKAKFHVHESQHLRVICLDTIPAARIRSLVEFGERVIEAFRKEFVDPYRGEDFRDYVPDGLFQEFYFGPEDVDAFEQFRTQYYGQGWGNAEERDRSLKMSGSNLLRGGVFVSYWKLLADTDLDGIVAHRLGHTLAVVHGNRGRANADQDWIEEACGYYTAFGFLGRNSVTCFAFARKDYATPKPQEAERTVQEGLKGHFNALALAKGSKIDQLALKKLHQIGDEDFAKAWSFFDFIAARKGKEGQLFLRSAFAAAGAGRAGMLERWRAEVDKLFPAGRGVDVFDVLEKEWRAYAEHEQVRDRK